MRLKWWVLLVIWNYSRQRNTGNSDAVQVVVDFYGPSDISQVRNNKPVTPLWWQINPGFLRIFYLVAV